MPRLESPGTQRNPGRPPRQRPARGARALPVVAALLLAACGAPSPLPGSDPGTEPVVVALSDRMAFAVPVDPGPIVAMPPGGQCAPLPGAGALLPGPAPGREVPRLPADPVPPSDAPLRALGAYIAHSGDCDPDLVEWNGRRLDEAVAGELSRHAYYRMLTYLRWGDCGRPAFSGILEDLLEAARRHGDGTISTREFEARETDLVGHFFAAVREEEEPPVASSGNPVSPEPEPAPSPSPTRARVSGAPLQALTAYIEHSGTCPRDLVEWNRDYGSRAMTGETSRAFYYRVLGYVGWGGCGRDFFAPVFQELQKSAEILSQGAISETQFEDKEAELVGLLFSALGDGKRGLAAVQAYERTTMERLADLPEPRQYFNCTFFGSEHRCRE